MTLTDTHLIRATTQAHIIEHEKIFKNKIFLRTKKAGVKIFSKILKKKQNITNFLQRNI